MFPSLAIPNRQAARQYKPPKDCVSKTNDENTLPTTLFRRLRQKRVNRIVNLLPALSQLLTVNLPDIDRLQCSSEVRCIASVGVNAVQYYWVCAGLRR